MSKNLKIQVVKPYLPDVDKYKKYIDEIYKNCQLTNNGVLVQELEKRLEEYLGVKNVVLVANGTLALSVAYQALNIQGEVVTTPFSFVATTSSLVSGGLVPVFSDIDPETLNIDPELIVSKITERTSAILPVHIFGNACKIEKIQEIANDYNLKIIYDAAQAFDVEYKGRSILNYGDISILSLHATKIFHTIEGGALIINDDSLVEKVRRIINFGYDTSGEILNIGINAKMNEFEAAMGLCTLDDLAKTKKKRKRIYNLYSQQLRGLCLLPHWNKHATKNYGYFPILLKNNKQLLRVQNALNDNQIYPRRYFYPSLDLLPYVKKFQICENSQCISERILCLPLYDSLTLKEAQRIINIVKSCSL